MALRNHLQALPVLHSSFFLLLCFTEPDLAGGKTPPFAEQQDGLDTFH